MGRCGASGQYRRTGSQPDPDAAFRPRGRAPRPLQRQPSPATSPPLFSIGMMLAMLIAPCRRC
ncbi:MAG: hypothetical protein ACLS69_04340 [Butyricicoccus sp.]